MVEVGYQRPLPPSLSDINEQLLGNGYVLCVKQGKEEYVSDIPEFDPNKVSLQIPGEVLGPGFNIANGASQVVGTLIQNTALRIAKLFESLKPLFRSSSSGFKSSKRETSGEIEEFMDDGSEPGGDKIEEKSPVKSSFAALTQTRRR